MQVALAIYPPGKREGGGERERESLNNDHPRSFFIKTAYLAVVLCGYILHCTIAQLWSHVSVCPSTLVVQMTEVLRWNYAQKFMSFEQYLHMYFRHTFTTSF